MGFKSFLPASSSRPVSESKRGSKVDALKRVLAETFDFTTVLLFGALIQGSLLLLIPRVWVLAPTFIILLSRATTTLAITKNWAENPYIKNSIPQRVTAILPNAEGEFNKEGHPTNEKVAIFLLGLRSNHPMGYFAPHLAKINELNTKMSNTLDAEAPDNGFLGQTTWSSRADNGALDLLLISYWRSIDDVLKFSVSPSHKETWAWWENHAAELKHIGISHEAFEADKSMYENVYLNFQPTRMGATSFFRQGDEMVGGTVPDQWVNPLVDASKGKLRTAMGRRGITVENAPEKPWLADEKTNGHAY